MNPILTLLDIHHNVINKSYQGKEKMEKLFFFQNKNFKKRVVTVQLTVYIST